MLRPPKHAGRTSPQNGIDKNDDARAVRGNSEPGEVTTGREAYPAIVWRVGATGLFFQSSFGAFAPESARALAWVQGPIGNDVLSWSGLRVAVTNCSCSVGAPAEKPTSCLHSGFHPRGRSKLP